jgi:hypothetical protein
MNATTRYAILVVYCLFGTPALAAEATAPLKCGGLFGRDTSHAKLLATFGAGKAITEYDGEVDAEVTILFPDDPKRRLKIQWKNQKDRRDLGSITIARRSSWRVAGLSIGTPLAEVERLNGGPFKLNYFEGDYGGAIIDWMGGKLDARLPGGCMLGAFVAIEEGVSLDAVNKEIAPDRTLLSSGEGLRAPKPFVSAIIVSFGK